MPVKSIGKLIKGLFLSTDPVLSNGEEHPITFASDGRIRVDSNPSTGSKEFIVVFKGLAAPGGQFFEVLGASGVVGRIVEIYFFKPSVGVEFKVLKQSVVSTGGTTTSNAAVPNDSADTAGLTYKTYTAAPTAGTLVGAVIDVKSVTAGDILGFTFGDIGDKPLVIRNTESVAFSTDIAATVYGYCKVRESTT